MLDPLDLEYEIKELFIKKMGEFQVFCEEMQINESDRKRDPYALDWSDEYLKGYNAALTDGVKTAVELWTEGYDY